MGKLIGTMTKEKPLKAQELAEEIGVSRRTILNWHQDGVIPSQINVNRIIRFSLTDVLEALQSKSVR